MPEMWDPPTEPGAFSLPGDGERYGLEEETPAEQEAPAEEQASEEAPAQEGRPRNPDGTFAPAQTAEEKTPAEPDDPALTWARERYGDEVTPKVAKALWHQEQFLQRQGTEIGDLRKAVEGLPSQIQQQTPQPQPNYDYDTLIDQDPATAAQLAYESGDGVRLQQAVAAWNEVSPGTPQVWAQNLQLQERLNQQEQQFNEQLAPIQQRTAQQVSDQAFSQFSRTHPDVDQYADQMSQVLQQSPHLQPLIESSDPNAKVELLDYLYTKSKGLQARGDADNLASALRNSAQDVARAEEEAAVVSTSQRTTEPEQPSEAEKIGAIWDERRRPFDEGWNIQSG